MFRGGDDGAASGPPPAAPGRCPHPSSRGCPGLRLCWLLVSADEAALGGDGRHADNKRAVFDLLSVSPSWNRFSHSHVSSKGIFLGLVQSKIMLQKKFPSSRLLLLNREWRAPGVSPAKLTSSSFPRERCTFHPSTMPRRRKKKPPTNHHQTQRSHPFNTHTSASLPRRELSRGAKNPPVEGRKPANDKQENWR